MSELEPTPPEFVAMMHEVTRFGEGVLAGLPTSRASDHEGAAELAAELDEASPTPARLTELLEILDRASRKGMNHLHPGYLAFIPIAGMPIGAIGDHLASLLNRYVTVSWGSPAMAQLEWNALRWVGDIFGYPSTMRGVFTSGGSLANFTAVVTARHARLGDSHSQGKIYVTDQTHHSVTRSARLAGFAPGTVTAVPTTPDLKMDPAALQDAVRRDREGGHRPFLVVASAGTTNAGTVDPLDAVCDVAEAEGLWVHVDGAYGGGFVLTERGKQLMAGIDRADSITVDPHKCFFFPNGIGCILVRDGQALKQAHLGEAAYLTDLAHESPIPNFSDHSIEQSRNFRGLKVWMALKLYGWQPFAEALQVNLDAARTLYETLRDDERFVTPWKPDLSTTVFRLTAGDEQTVRMLDGINRRGKVFMSSTTIMGDTYVRACFLSHRTTSKTLDDAVTSIMEAAAEVD